MRSLHCSFLFLAPHFSLQAVFCIIDLFIFPPCSRDIIKLVEVLLKNAKQKCKVADGAGFSEKLMFAVVVCFSPLV